MALEYSVPINAISLFQIVPGDDPDKAPRLQHLKLALLQVLPGVALSPSL
jgi:hypothetical protein